MERRNGFPVLIAQLARVWNEQHWDLEAPGSPTKRVSYFLREPGQSPRGLSLARGLWPGRRRRQVCLREHHPQALSLHSPVLSLSQRRGRDGDDLPGARKCLVPRSALEDPWDQVDPEEVKGQRQCCVEVMLHEEPQDTEPEASLLPAKTPARDHASVSAVTAALAQDTNGEVSFTKYKEQERRGGSVG